MRKVISILLLSVYLFSTTQLPELLKLPVLVTHFIEHKQLDRHISFWDFLCLHYAHGDVHDADYARDMQLPFKATVHSQVAFTAFVVPSPVVILTAPPNFKERTQKRLSDSFAYCSNYLSAIWQPPKSC